MAQGTLVKTKTKWYLRETLSYHHRLLNFREQRVVLNGQHSSWTSIEAGVPQGSILGPLLFLIYINHLSDDLTTNVTLFADDTSLVSVVHNMNTSTINLNNDLNKIRNWAIHWEMNFNPILANKLKKLYFQESLKRPIIIQFIFNTTPFNKFSLKNILECILILNWIFRNT